MDTTPNLALPYLMPSQAQKHVTHNEALRRLDALVQIGVESATLTAPPNAPNEGARYIIGPAATGQWSGRERQLAAWQDGAWQYFEPLNGWTVRDAATGDTLVFDGSDWVQAGLGSGAQNVPLLGINTTAEPASRLAVAASGSLFTHEGDDHRLTINRSAETDTASVLFKTGSQGNAEFGLAGDGGFSLKVSADGSAWKTGLSIDRASGIVKTPNRPVARATLGGGWLSVSDGDETGFNNLTQSQGGFALGAALSDGPGKYLVVPAAGLYLVILRAFVAAGSDLRLNLTTSSHATPPLIIETCESPNKASTQHSIGIIDLPAGCQLAFSYLRNGQCFHAVNHTEITLAAI